MRMLIMGGSGIISSACVELAVERGIDVTVVNRGNRPDSLPAGVRLIHADVHEEDALRRSIGDQTFDVVADFIAFAPAHVERDIRVFSGRCGQFVFISSASAYQKPPGDWLITESTPLGNLYWQYSRDKIACEEVLTRAWREGGFPITIVRPSLTYGRTLVPLIFNSWNQSYTLVDRLRRGLPVVVPGDGTNPWTITHNTDFAKGFVGLLGHPLSIAQAFHITSDEALTWDQYVQITAQVAGAPPAKIVHIPSDLLSRIWPEKAGSLLGDKSRAAVFDNAKLRRLVPDYAANTHWARGVAQTIAWFDQDASRRAVDRSIDNWHDRVIASWEACSMRMVEELRRV